jgi:hypothetical protein
MLLTVYHPSCRTNNPSFQDKTMQPQLTFSFDPNTSSATILFEVATWLEMTGTELNEVVAAINGGVTPVPSHIKQAVERIGADNPANGVEVSPAIAFGGLLNGAGGPNVSAPSTAVVETSATALTASTGTLATLPVASSAPALPQEQTAVAQPVNAATANPVVTDKDGLPHDVRIHSKDPTLTDKGFWRKKRGVTDDTVRTVEAELRRIAQLAPPVTQATSTGNVQVDELTRKAAAIKFAHDEAVRVCGPQPFDDVTLNTLLSGKTVTLSPEQADWYSAYFSKRNAAYGEFISRAAPTHVAYERPLESVPAVPIVADVAPVAPINSPSLVDAAGLPWDARINLPMVAGNGLKDAAGIYLQRMDVAPETKLAVMAELRGNGAGTPSGAPLSDAGNTPVVPSVPQVSAADAGTSFVLMMRWIVQNVTSGKIAPTTSADIAKSFGFADADGNGAVALMASRTDYFPAFVATLQAYGAV